MKYLPTLRMPLWSFILTALVSVLLIGLTSCGDSDVEEARKRAEYAQIIDERSTKDLLNELYIASDGKTDALARILQVTPSSIERLRKGETSPTEAFQTRLKEVATYYAQHGKSFRELRVALDSEYTWYNRAWSWPASHIWLLLGIFVAQMVVGFILGAAEAEGLLALLGFGNVLVVLFWLLSGLLTWIISPDALNDPYTQSINPTIEVLVSDEE